MAKTQFLHIYIFIFYLLTLSPFQLNFPRISKPNIIFRDLREKRQKELLHQLEILLHQANLR